MTQINMSDLLAQETSRNPWTFYQQLRAQDPLPSIPNFFGMGKTAWIVTNYDDAIAILKDPRFTKDMQKVMFPQDGQSSGGPHASTINQALSMRRDMLMADPPDHTRLRGLVSKAFTPRMIEQLRPRIQQITDELLDAVQNQGKMDLINDFAYPLPITVISEMLGIPVADRRQFRSWTQTLVNVGEKFDQDTAAQTALEEFRHYIITLLAEKHEHPGNNLISGLVQAEENGDKLSEIELISTVFLLIVAGHETTVNLIGNSVLALLQHPDQIQLLRQDPSLLHSAIEELLRYTAPVMNASPRFAKEDIPMHGKVIRKGELVIVSLIAADIDPQQFSNPDVLDITRQENQHLAFGKGIHYCLGAPLARLEGQIAIGTLLQRMPNLRLAIEPEQLTWNRHLTLRGLRSLPVMF
jgi:cytochrome P450 PksS